jgi:hypothetical protein
MRFIPVVLALLLVSLLAFYFPADIQDKKEESSTSKISHTPIQTRSIPSGMREYRDPEFHISLLYPQELSVNKRAESGGAVTITFQNATKGLGFQIFVVPYADPQVSEEQFAKDNPSGIRDSLQPVVIDGALGSAFYSSDENLGPTREVWFIKNGFLFEVTTPKPLEKWLRDILATWEFTK